MTSPELKVEIAGIEFRNPVMLAAGILGTTAGIMRHVYEAGAGAVFTKSVGLEEREGYPNPAVVEVDCGLINAMGLPSPGISELRGEVSKLREWGVPVVVSVFGSKAEEYAEVASMAEEAGAVAVELNFSCPHVGEVSLIGQRGDLVEEFTRAVKDAVDIPVFVKLTPNVSDIASIARRAERGGADAVTAINTVRAMAIDIWTARPILGNRFGGLSGPAIRPIAVRCVYEIFEAVDIPVIGCGGVVSWMDAVELMLAGASAVQVGTAVIYRGMDVFNELVQGISAYLSKMGFRSVSEIVGLAHKA